MSSFSINRVTLKGNLGKDPEIRDLNNGDAVASFSVATTESWKDKNGERKERTEWHNVVVWPKILVDMCRTLKKGDTVLVEGKMATRSYEDQAGQKRWTTEVVVNTYDHLLDKIERTSTGNRAPSPNSRDYYGAGGTTGGSPNSGSQTGGFSRDLDDEIPF